VKVQETGRAVDRTGMDVGETGGVRLEQDVEQLDELGLMRRTARAMFGIGGLTVLASVPMPRPEPVDEVALAIAGALMLSAGLIVGWSRTSRMWLLRLCPAFGVVIISVIVGVVRPISGTPLFYLWPVIYGAYFFPRRNLVITLALQALTMAAAMAWLAKGEMKGLLWLDTVVSVSLVGTLVLVLRERLSIAFSRLYSSSITDGLTGLLNRRAFDRAFAYEVARADRHEIALTVVLFDLDHFKQVNDLHGHAAGDEALRRFSSIMAAEVRATDVAARIGGEEFAVLLLGCDRSDGRRFAERVCARLQLVTSREGRSLTASAGVAQFAMTGARDSDQLLRLADQALYAAKQAGRRRVAVWHGEPEIGEEIAAPDELAA
jgi:diguanylate cyclase (GGDEF)-like protein